jgi:segregation and condensation protein B
MQVWSVYSLGAFKARPNPSSENESRRVKPLRAREALSIFARDRNASSGLDEVAMLENDLLTDGAPPEEELVLRSRDELGKVLLALIFASSEPLTLRKLREAVDVNLDVGTVREVLEKANQQLADAGMPFEAVEAAGGWRFRTREEVFPWVRRMFGQEAQARRLSQAMLETLSIIAYKQPVTKAEIEAVRGVSCDGPIKSLLDRKLIALGPRSESPGNPFTYATTKDFLKYFGIQRLPDDLPRVQELEGLLNANQLLPQLPLRTADGKEIDEA